MSNNERTCVHCGVTRTDADFQSEEAREPCDFCWSADRLKHTEVFQCRYWKEECWHGDIPCISVSFMGYKVAWELPTYASVEVEGENRPPHDQRGDEIFFQMMQAAEQVRNSFLFDDVYAITLDRVYDELRSWEEVKNFVDNDEDLPF